MSLEQQEGDQCPHGESRGACERCAIARLFQEPLSEQELSRVQERVDLLFPAERRATLLAKADTDRLGRPVRYFRYVNGEAFAALLRDGQMNRATYDGAKTSQSTEETIKQLCRQTLSRACKSPEEDDQLYDLSYTDLVGRVFGKDAATLLEAVEQGSLETVRGLVAEAVPKGVQFDIVSGGMGRALVPWLSVSCGGPTLQTMNYLHMRFSRVYLECVIPETRVAMHHADIEHIQGEKEVFVQELRMEDIISCAVTEQAYREKYLDAPDSLIRAYKESGRLNPIDKDIPVEGWRWGETWEEILPPALLKRFGYDNISPTT